MNQKISDTTSALKKKPPGLSQSVRTFENNERVRGALLNSPKLSGVKHALAFNIFGRSFRRVVKDIAFHPYKLVQ